MDITAFVAISFPLGMGRDSAGGHVDHERCGVAPYRIRPNKRKQHQMIERKAA